MRRILFVLLLLCCSSAACAYDFEALSPSGHRLCFQILSAADHTCGVVHADGVQPSGHLVVPQRVAFQEEEYRVVALISTLDACTGFHGAFDRCDQLLSISLPDGLRSVGDHSFGGCSALESVSLPESVSYLGVEAFADCVSLRQVFLPSALVALPHGLFRGCSLLEEVALPASLDTVGDYAFSGCLSLTQVALPSTLRHVGEAAFSGSVALQQVVLPEGVEYLGEYAFYRCVSLLSVVSLSLVPPLVEGGGTFQGVPDSAVLRVPAAAVESYRTAFGWNRFARVIPYEGCPVASPSASDLSLQVCGRTLWVRSPRAVGLRLLDVWGREVASSPSATMAVFHLPQGGLYLLLSQHGAPRKVLLR